MRLLSDASIPETIDVLHRCTQIPTPTRIFLCIQLSDTALTHCAHLSSTFMGHGRIVKIIPSSHLC